MFARMDSVEAHHLSGTLDCIAQTLRRGGATESNDELRAIALGHLAHPERAAQLLSEDLFTSGAAVTQDGTLVPAGTGEGSTRARACRHGAELVVHLSAHDLASGTSGGDAVRIGPLTRTHLEDLLASCAGKVTVKPVVDLAAPLAVAQYRPSPGVRWVVLTRDGTEAYPWSERSAWSTRVDLDHTVPYDHAHPERGGATCTSNLAAWSRLTHRLKTHAGFQAEQESPGVLRWTTPTGRVYWATPHGTWNHPPPDIVTN